MEDVVFEDKYVGKQTNADGTSFTQDFTEAKKFQEWLSMELPDGVELSHQKPTKIQVSIFPKCSSIVICMASGSSGVITTTSSENLSTKQLSGFVV